MSLVPGTGGAGCSGVLDTLLCPPSPSSPGGWQGPSPARGCGDKGPLQPGWGPASEAYCRLGRRPERGIVLSLPGLLGMLVFWVIKQL